MPVFRRVHTYLTQSYLASVRSTEGLSALPGGAAYYDFTRPRRATTCNVRSPPRRRRCRSCFAQALGSRFDIRAFHRQVLDTGSVPMAVLEAKIAAWTAAW